MNRIDFCCILLILCTNLYHEARCLPPASAPPGLKPIPFPETKSGVEISLLKNLFDEQEASIALKLSALPESIDKIHGRFKDGEITKDLLALKLNGLFVKGAIMSVPDHKGPG